MNDSNYWGPPRHDLPLTHAPPNPTSSYQDPGLGGGANWGTPINTGTSFGNTSGHSGATGGVSVGYVNPTGPLPRGRRSPWVAAVLTLLFGPFGLFYVGILTGIVALIVLPFLVTALAFAISSQRGAGLDSVASIAVPILWAIAIPWAIVGVKIRNARIERAATKIRAAAKDKP
jgi:hypothetical protein